MSVEVTRLASGLSVVTDRMPHLESASLGVWVGAGSRNEKPDEHGISHLLEHMAFKGTKRRSARQIAEEIEAVGGDLNAATSVESTAYYARVLKADVPLALDVLSDILSEPTFDPEELRREQNVIVQEIGAVRRRARRSGVRAPAGDRVSRAAGRPLDPRHAGNRALVQFGAHSRLSGAQLSRARHAGGRRRRRRARANRRRGREALRELHRTGRAGAGAGAFRRRHAGRDARSRAGAYRAGAARLAGARRAALQPAGVHQRARRRHVVAAVPGGAREARALLRDPRLPHALFRHRPVRASMPAPTRRTRPN